MTPKEKAKELIEKNMKQQIEYIVRSNWGYDNVDVEKITEQIIELYKPKWISSEKELPEHKETVLTSDDYGGIATAYYDRKARQWFSDEGEGWDEISHWMPLPDKPILRNEK